VAAVFHYLSKEHFRLYNRAVYDVFLVIVFNVGDDDIGRKHQAGDRSGVLQGGAGDLGRVNNAGLEHIHKFAFVGVKAGRIVLFQQLFDNYVAVQAAVVDDLPGRRFQCAAQNIETDFLIAFGFAFTFGYFRNTSQKNHAAADDNAFLGSRFGGVQRVVQQVLAFLHFRFCRGSGFNDGNAAGQLGQAFLKFLAVVITGGFFYLAANLLAAGFNVFFRAFAFDNRCVFLADDDFFWLCQAGSAQGFPA